MRITCGTIAQFVDVVAGLVERGIMFEATADNLTIVCTGGF